ncbi:MAG: alanine racemase [Eubacteriales bacterium]|nr:alanine racemase [Eubacteriales bacterium]
MKYFGMFKDSDVKYQRAVAEIDLGRAVHNIISIRNHMRNGLKLCAIVKADAYGHGAVEYCKAVNEYADYFAVASLGEGLVLREADINKPILILGSIFPEEIEEAVKNDLSMTIFQINRAELISKKAGELGKTASVHFAVDTGMSRIGLLPDEQGVEEAAKIASLPNISIDGTFTHFATADEGDISAAREQYRRFKYFLDFMAERNIPTGLRHCSNSAGIVKELGTELDMVRAGMILYGYAPSYETDCELLDLKPVMSLKSRLAYIKTVKQFTKIGYGGSFTAPYDMKIGTVNLGYADGYYRNLSNKGAEVLIRGKRCRIVGRICMDQFMVDLTDIKDVSEGDVVTLIGRDGEEEITALELSKLAGHVHYEILCAINGRVPRKYIF